MIRVVTSFSQKGHLQYGQRFINTFLEHWPESVELHVFTEGPQKYPTPGVAWHDLHLDPAHQAFCERYSGPQFNSPTDFNMMSVKFAHKVFAVTSPELPVGGWRIWIDADVETTRKVTPEHLAALAPPDKLLTFLGRTGWMRPGQPMYTECGFVGYNTDDLRVCAMLHDMRAIYTTGKLFTLGLHNWHDSYVFDHVRTHLGFPPGCVNNLSVHLPPGTFHPWASTVLGEIMVHHKGPKRKIAAYGAP